ncbi:12898_t:CDS:1, partial [Gigaspora margarita]
MSISNLLYPDNPKHLHRANELQTDIANISHLISDKKCIFDTKLENLKKVFEAAANKIHIPNDDKMNKFINKIDDNHKISILIQRPIEFLISVPLVALAYRRAALTFLLRTGRIGEAAFSRLVGFPIGARI